MNTIMFNRIRDRVKIIVYYTLKIRKVNFNSKHMMIHVLLPLVIVLVAVQTLGGRSFFNSMRKSNKNSKLSFYNSKFNCSNKKTNN